MNINSCLNSASVKMTCNDFINHLRSEIDAYKTIDNRISAFLSGESSTSESITGIKTQMGDYSLVMGTLCTSNEADISDAGTLMELVGNETLDGRLIFHEQKAASEEASSCRGKASSARYKGDNATEPGESARYYAEASYWDGKAWIAEQRYNFYKRKEERYDEINAASASLFTKSSVGRTKAYQLLALMHDSFVEGKYVFTADHIQLRNDCNKVIKEKWEKDGAFDGEKAFEGLKDCENMTVAEFNAFVSFLNDNGISVPGDISKEELKTAVEKALLDKIAKNSGTPYENLTQEERELFVYLYEENNPEQAAILDEFTKDMPTGMGVDYDGNPHSFDNDNINIRFMVYVSPEPEKTLFLEYAPEIEVVWDCECKAYWGYDEKKEPSGYEDGKYRLHIDLTGCKYYDDLGNEHVVNPEIDNKRGAYVTLFHEFGHALDDLYLDGKQGGRIASRLIGLNGQIVAEVKEDVKNNVILTCNNNGINLTEKQIKKITDVICGAKPDNLPTEWTDEMREAYEKTIYEYEQNFEDASQYGAWDINSTPKYECVTDVYWGVTDCQICDPDYGYAHRPGGGDSYWYNSKGKIYNSPASEFWAENFSYAMTYSPKGQIDATVAVFPESYEMYTNAVQEMKDYILTSRHPQEVMG